MSKQNARPGTGTDPEEPSTTAPPTPKKQKMDEEATTSEVPQPTQDKHGGLPTTQQERQGAVGGVDTGATGTKAFLYGGLKTQKAVLHYKRTWLFYTRPYAKQILKKTNVGTQHTKPIMTTSMAAFPTNIPFMFMNYAEFTQLPPDTKLLKTHCELILRHATTTFASNESNVQTVTAANQLYIDYCKGQVLKGNGTVVKYEAASGSMIPTAVNNLSLDWNNTTNTIGPDMQTFFNKLWVTTGNDPPACMGTFKEHDWYLAFNASTATEGHGVISLDQLYGTVNAVTNYNTDMMVHTQHFNNCFVKKQKTPAIPLDTDASENNTLYLMSRLNGLTPTNYLLNGEYAYDLSRTYNGGTVGGDFANDDELYYSEWSDTYRSGVTDHAVSQPCYPPWLFAGLREITALGPTQDSLEYLQGACQWQYECECSVEIDLSSMTSVQPTKSYAHFRNAIKDPTIAGYTPVQGTLDTRSTTFAYNQPRITYAPTPSPKHYTGRKFM